MLAAETVADVGDDGERVVGLHHDPNYFSHLSVYRFAIPFLKGKRVLDAGCGTGYGTAYLVDNGIEFAAGADYSNKAISFAQQNYGGANREFVVANLGQRFPFQNAEFDAIFSSQAMEHIGAIEVFFSECCRVLKPGGIMIFSVPAITSRLGLRSLEENIRNIYHVTNLTPLGWFSKASRYFEEVSPYHHWLSPEHSAENWDELMRYFHVSPADNRLSENDFTYTPMPIEQMNAEDLNLNAVFVARVSRSNILPHIVEEFIPHEWQEGEIGARVRREYGDSIRTELQSQISQLTKELSRFLTSGKEERDKNLKSFAELTSRTNINLDKSLSIALSEIENLQHSTSWRLTAPLRAIGKFLRNR
ncbi:methyltransferase domain-containing protein [Phyllobacterium myrsinacearum]|uniref:SAM-dependent methyltransferase n=1 Tax=Phyllobacterium myrsinacearum TaxID=28101 RepID=A0A839EVH3_9HYPH|nr:SAM-dependent methyltransferase [Phyllobacterium myrsinacearum]